MMERTKTVAQALASLVAARINCAKSGNGEWLERHSARIQDLQDNYLPSGSGIDNGCHVDLENSTGDELVIDTSYHHMDDGGSYDGWTEHTLMITPTFDGFSVDVSGRNRNDIKEYLADTFHMALSALVTETADGFSPAAAPSL